MTVEPMAVETQAPMIAAIVARSLEHGRAETAPYRHWLLSDVFPEAVSTAISALPFAPPDIDDTGGTRESHNSSRTFFSAANRGRFDVCRGLAEALQGDAVVGALERVCALSLKGTFLRIEYCQDTDGFWLEPHTDISPKRLTLQVTLSTEPGSEKWGTDIFDEDLNHVATLPHEFNGGLVFVPAKNTWHGFRKRPLGGVRKLVIINYVGDDWRARDQLAYPDRPVG